MAVTVNEGTQTDIYSVANAGTEIQVVKLDVGAGTAISDFGGTVRDVANITKGTVTRVEGGTIAVNMLSGTLNVGTVANAGTVVEVNKGTINLGTVAVSSLPTSGTIVLVGNVGTLEVGTFTNTGTVVNVATGTINVGTATVSGNVGVTTGTITTGSLTNLATLHNGTVVMPSGTVTSVTNIVGGTIGSVLGIGGTVQVSGASAGTFVNIVTGTQQTLGTVGVVNNLTNGSINLLTGTLTRVSNIGTLESGTVQISSLPVVLGTSYGTLGTTGALVWGTLVSASGAGTRQYVSGLSITVMSGTVDVAITNESPDTYCL